MFSIECISFIRIDSYVILHLDNHKRVYQHPNKHKRCNFLDISNTILNRNIVIAQSGEEERQYDTKARHLHYPCENKIWVSFEVQVTSFEQYRINH